MCKRTFWFVRWLRNSLDELAGLRKHQSRGQKLLPQNVAICRRISNCSGSSHCLASHRLWWALSCWACVSIGVKWLSREMLTIGNVTLNDELTLYTFDTSGAPPRALPDISDAVVMQLIQLHDEGVSCFAERVRTADTFNMMKLDELLYDIVPLCGVSGDWQNNRRKLRNKILDAQTGRYVKIL